MNGNSRAARHDEAGFSLVEVLIAVVVLSFGLMAIANLFAMSTSSNVAARHLTAAATQATELLETLKAVPFTGLTPGGQADLLAELDKDAATGQRFTADQPVRASSTANVVNAYEADRDVDGVGTIRIRWRIVAIDQQTRYIRVAAASASSLLRARSRVEMVTYRTCAGPRLGCPATP